MNRRSLVPVLASVFLACGGTDAPIDAFVPPDAPPPRCGDGFINEGEACDDGNVVDGAACPSDCLARCGDGVVTPPEACDDGNDEIGDGCHRCVAPGQPLWATTSCIGPLTVAPDGTLLQGCSTSTATTLIRLNVEGEILEVWPRELLAGIDPVGQFRVIATDEAGDIYLGVRVVDRGVTGAQVFAFSRDMRLKWTRNLEGGVQFWSMAVRGSQVLIGVADDYRSGVSADLQNARFWAFSTTDGSITWTYQSPNGSIADVGALDASGGAAVVTAHTWDADADLFSRRRMHRFDATGTELWSTELDWSAFPDDADGRVEVSDIWMDESGIRLTGFRLVDDGTATHEAVWSREFDLSGRITVERYLVLREHRGVRWDALRSGQPVTSYSADLTTIFGYPYWRDPDQTAIGFAEDGSERWRVHPVPTSTSFTEWSPVELENLFCASDPSGDVARTTCWLTR